MDPVDALPPEAELEQRRAARDSRAVRMARADELRRLAENQDASDFRARVLQLCRTAPRADDEAPVDEERKRVGDRRLRLVKAGVSDVDAIAAIVSAAAPPVVVTNAGNAAAFRAAQAFLDDRKRRILTLAGTAGVGKTWAAIWCVAATDDSLWVASDDIRPDDDWTRLRSRTLAAPLVVLNDLSGRASDWAAGEASDLICRRHDKGQRTVITTNLRLRLAGSTDPRQTLEGRYGDRVIDRVFDARYGIAQVCVGASLRGRA